jgi:ribose transport system substrate-binding protein
MSRVNLFGKEAKMLSTKRIACLGTLIVLLVGAAPAAAPGGAARSAGKGVAGGKLRIGFATIVLNDPFFVLLNKGMRQTTGAAGASLSIVNPNGDPVAQANAVQTFITQGFDAILTDPIDPNSLRPAIQKAHAAKIPVVLVDEVLRGQAIRGDANVAVDDAGGSKTLADAVIKYAKAHHIAKIQAAAIYDQLGPIEQTRVNAFEAELEKVPGAKLVGRCDNNFSAQKALTCAKDLMTANPGVNFLYTAGGVALLASLQAVDQGHKGGRVKVVGWGFISKSFISAMKRGVMLEALNQDTIHMGQVAASMAIKLAQGKHVPKDTTVRAIRVTAANAAQFWAGPLGGK